jgi:protein phosphatase methylesterase 1
MQGKFQMVVVRHTGHAIQVPFFLVVPWTMTMLIKLFSNSENLDYSQEDVPEEFASLILNFISRNRIGPCGVEVCEPFIPLFV